MTISNIPARIMADNRLNNSDIRVLMSVHTHANSKTGWCFIQQRLICADTGLSKPTVERALRNLKKHNYLISTPRYRDDGSLSCNEYKILYDTEDNVQFEGHPLHGTVPSRMMTPPITDDDTPHQVSEGGGHQL
jgi:DNA-binding transcriptional MocR family regulator